MHWIAVEEHVLPFEVRQAWAVAPPPHDPVSAFADGGEAGVRLADLGDGRLSLTTPGLHNLEPSHAVDTARRVNDLIAETCVRRPDRFQGFATLPTADPEVAPLE